MKRISAFLVAMMCWSAAGSSQPYGKYVGGDISDLPLYEQHNNSYLDAGGNKISDLITWFRDECQWNTFRVRLFVNPTRMDNDGTENNSVCQDTTYVKSLGRRIKDAECSFLLDFHYTDTWADATHHGAPAVCSGMTTDEKATWIYNYTRESLETLVRAGATPDLVQVGNEIMYGFMGINVHPYASSGDDWTGFLKVLNSGCQAVRDVCPEAKIIIHTDKPQRTDWNTYYYDKLVDYGVPFDVMGLSYYPFWHGYLNSTQSSKANSYISGTLDALQSDARLSGKTVQIVETGYNFQYWPSQGVNFDTQSIWPCSAEGQYAFIKDLVAELSRHSNVDALMYWFPEEAGNGDDTDYSSSKGSVIPTWLNRGFWWPKNSGGHWPVTTTAGMACSLMKDFLSPVSSVESVTVTRPYTPSSNRTYNLSGQPVPPTTKTLLITSGKKYLPR